jgi:hypothetical protein
MCSTVFILYTCNEFNDNRHINNDERNDDKQVEQQQ